MSDPNEIPEPDIIQLAIDYARKNRGLKIVIVLDEVRLVITHE